MGEQILQVYRIYILDLNQIQLCLKFDLIQVTELVSQSLL
jgi:hypothetical protein